MEANRTYGIEIECLSSIDRTELTSKINEALIESGSAHRATEASWSRQTDSTNLNVWIVKTDGSLRTEPNFAHNVEVVSPVLIGDDGLQALKLVTGVLEVYCRVNKSCGLHVHHGLLNTDDPINILIGWLRIEDTLYECLPVSRKEGSYAKKLSKQRRVRKNLNRETVDNTGLRRWWSSHVGGRYFGLNFESIWIRNTVEVRAAAGTVEYDKIVNWAEVTQRIMIMASRNPMVFREGIDNVTAIITGTAREAVRREVNRRVRTTNLTRYGHQRNTMNEVLDNMIWAGAHLIDLANALIEFRANRGETITYDQARAKVKGHVNWLKNNKGIRIESWGRGNPHYKALDEHLPEQAPIAEPTVHNNVGHMQMVDPVGENVIRAAEWLRQRHAKFYPRHNPVAAVAEAR